MVRMLGIVKGGKENFVLLDELFATMAEAKAEAKEAYDVALIDHALYFEMEEPDVEL